MNILTRADTRARTHSHTYRLTQFHTHGPSLAQVCTHALTHSHTDTPTHTHTGAHTHK